MLGFFPLVLPSLPDSFCSNCSVIRPRDRGRERSYRSKLVFVPFRHGAYLRWA